MKKAKFGFFFVIAFIFTLFIASPLATNNVKAATSGGYSLKPAGESNDNVDIGNGSYVVTGDPGQTVELKLMVINKESSARKFEYFVNTAYTSDTGALSYNKTKVSDPSLKIKTSSLATPNQSIFQIPGNTTATLTAKITIPEQKFNGYLMGAFTVTPYKEKAKGTVGANGTLIKNKFSYSIPIQVHQKDADMEETKLSVMSVKPASMVNGAKQAPGVQARVHNSMNSYAGSLDSKAIVTKKGDKKFKVTAVKGNQNIAPTSNYNYSISWGNKALQAGDYHLKLTYKTAGGLKSWVINKDFTITNNDAAKYNKLAGIKPNYLWLYILLGVLALAIILGLGIYLGRRNNNKGNNDSNNSGNTTRRRRR